MPKMLKAAMRQYWFTGAATAVVVASAAYYVAFGGPDTVQTSKGKKSKDKSRNKLSGLINEGNTCFINATIQALAACPIFIWWVDKVLDEPSDLLQIVTTSSLQLMMAGKYKILKFSTNTPPFFLHYKNSFLFIFFQS